MGLLKSLKKEYKRGYKSITKTKFGKILFTAAVIYAGYWVYGKIAAANAVEPLVLAEGTAGAIDAEAAVAAGDISMTAPPTDAVTVSSGAGSSGATPAFFEKGSTAVNQQLAGGASTGNAGIIAQSIKDMATGVGTFVEKNPLVSAMMLNAGVSMAGDDESDLMAQQAREEKKTRLRRESNLMVGDLDLGVSPGQEFLAKRGIINKQIVV